jgi:hypothetical protein
MNKWESLVAEFGQLIGADGLEIASAGACRLELDERLAIDFELDLHQGLHLYCVMPAIALEHRGAVALGLMAQNYLNQRRHVDATFSHDEGAGAFLLHLRVPEQVTTLEDLEAVIRDFTETAEAWSLKLEGGRLEGEAEAPSPLLMQRV